jgi:predicted nucleic acid-binding protein
VISAWSVAKSRSQKCGASRGGRRDWIKPAEAGRLINQIRHLAIMVDPIPRVSASPDPADDYLLAMAVSGHADYLVTGDKSDLLALERFKRTRIVTIRRFLLARS